jgi:hypothetical protein
MKQGRFGCGYGKGLCFVYTFLWLHVKIWIGFKNWAKIRAKEEAAQLTSSLQSVPKCARFCRLFRFNHLLFNAINHRFILHANLF